MIDLAGLSKRIGGTAALLGAIVLANTTLPAMADGGARGADTVERCAARPDRECLIAWATTAIRDLAGSEHRATALREIAGLRAGSGRFDEAEAAAGLIVDASTRSMTQIDIAIALHRAGRPDAAARVLASAIETARLIADDARRWSAFRVATAALDATDRFDDALAFAGAITEPTIRVTALADLGIGRARAGDVVAAYRVVDAIGAPAYRSDVLAAAAAAHAAAGETARADRAFRRAIAAVDGTDEGHLMASRIAEIAGMQAAAGLFRQAQVTAASIPGAVERAMAERRIALAFAEARRFPEALATARSTGRPSWRAVALAGVAARMRAEPDLARRVFREAEEAVGILDDAADRDWALAGLSAAYLDAGEFDRSLAAARRTVTSGARWAALSAAATAQARAGRLDDARRTADAIGDAGWRRTALGVIAPALAEAGRFDDAVRTAEAMGDRDGRAAALGVIATIRAAEGHPMAAVGLARSITFGPRRVLALLAVAGTLPD